MRLVFGRFLPELPLLGHLRSLLLLACRHLVAHPVGSHRPRTRPLPTPPLNPQLLYVLRACQTVGHTSEYPDHALVGREADPHLARAGQKACRRR